MFTSNRRAISARSCAHGIARVLRRLARVSSDDTLDFYLFTIHLQLGPILPAFPLIINLETRIRSWTSRFANVTTTGKTMFFPAGGHAAAGGKGMSYLIRRFRYG